MAHPKLIHWNLVVIFVCRSLQSRLVSFLASITKTPSKLYAKNLPTISPPQHICQTLFLISIFYQYLHSLLATHLLRRNTPYNTESTTFPEPVVRSISCVIPIRHCLNKTISHSRLEERSKKKSHWINNQFQQSIPICYAILKLSLTIILVACV